MKKIVLSVFVSVIALSQVIAMSNDKVAKTSVADSNDPHQLVDIYSADNDSSKKLGSIAFKDREKYNIFFCNKNTWCKVVDSRNGDTGWISLEKLQESQQKYNQVMQKNVSIDKLVQYVGLQDKKIMQLQQMIMQMQKEFTVALNRQQMQINKFKQSAYY